MARGSSSRSGPAPDPNALRRDRDSKDWITLPEEGRKGPLPKWPLATRANAAEQKMWTELWTRPQAVVWEDQQQFDEVALYVRRFVEASKPKSSTSLTTAVRQLQEALGLSVPGLQRNRWKIGRAQTEERGQVATVSSRERFRVVDGTG